LATNKVSIFEKIVLFFRYFIELIGTLIASNNAFIFDIAAANIALLMVGVIQEPIDPDLAWWVLTGIVSGTLIIYAASLIWYESKY
jgi:uncharacterized membrane protein